MFVGKLEAELKDQRQAGKTAFAFLELGNVELEHVVSEAFEAVARQIVHNARLLTKLEAH